MADCRFVVYGGSENHGLDARVMDQVNEATNLGLGFNHIWHETFPDGEPGFLLEDHEQIQGGHAVIFSCPVTHQLESELRDLITGCKLQYHAKSVTVVLSFLRYGRQDRAEKVEEITRLRWFIHSLKGYGADRLVVCEPHSVENTVKHCREFNLDLHISDPTKCFAVALHDLIQNLGPRNVKIYSPDFGSVGRGMHLAKEIGVSVVATPKRRINSDTVDTEVFEAEPFLKRIRDAYGSDVSVSCDMGDLRGKHVFMREDELSTGTTAVFTAGKLREIGAKSVRFAATHPVCTRGWKMKFFPVNGRPPFDDVWLGNTRPRGEGQTTYRGSTGGRVNTVDMAPAIAETLAQVLLRINESGT